MAIEQALSIERAVPMVGERQQHELFVKLLREHQGQIFGYILALVHNLADADDLFQRTCLVMWRKFGEFDPDTNFVRWGCAVARLEVLEFMRARRRKPMIFSEELQQELAVLQSEADAEVIVRRQEALAACMAKLSSVDRQMVEMCYGRDVMVEEAAESFGRSKHSIYNSLRRIRTALLECIRRQFAQEGLL
jgi:RNA polymerase sigma-70 factor (ECF subfamily)